MKENTPAPPLKTFEEIAQRVNSHFFTMDIAKSQDKGWLIVELGDGQVAGLPDNADVKAFYSMFKFLSYEPLAKLILNGQKGNGIYANVGSEAVSLRNDWVMGSISFCYATSCYKNEFFYGKS
jgi:hypothetical protein